MSSSPFLQRIVTSRISGSRNLSICSALQMALPQQALNAKENVNYTLKTLAINEMHAKQSKLYNNENHYIYEISTNTNASKNNRR